MIAKRREEEGKRDSVMSLFCFFTSSVLFCCVLSCFCFFYALSRRSDEATGLMDLYFSFLLLLRFLAVASQQTFQIDIYPSL